MLIKEALMSAFLTSPGGFHFAKYRVDAFLVTRSDAIILI
jgi:hypothetical protein